MSGLVANSSGVELKGGEVGTAGLGQRDFIHPRCDSQEVNCDGSDDMLQAGFCKTSVAGAAQPAASDSLRMCAFDTGTEGIGLAELIR